jgi:hypothetical protein
VSIWPQFVGCRSVEPIAVRRCPARSQTKPRHCTFPCRNNKLIPTPVATMFSNRIGYRLPRRVGGWQCRHWSDRFGSPYPWQAVVSQGSMNSRTAKRPQANPIGLCEARLTTGKLQPFNSPLNRPPTIRCNGPSKSTPKEVPDFASMLAVAQPIRTSVRTD